MEKEAEFSFPTTVRSLYRFRPPDHQNRHRQQYILFLNFVGLGIKFRFDSFLLLDFWILYQNVCFLNFRYLLLFCFFRLQKSLKILILVWVLLFLILTKFLGLNKYRVECCIDIYFRFFLLYTHNQ